MNTRTCTPTPSACVCVCVIVLTLVCPCNYDINNNISQQEVLLIIRKYGTVIKEIISCVHMAAPGEEREEGEEKETLLTEEVRHFVIKS